MGYGVIIACRMNSQRLPGKTLAAVGDRPLLWYVWSRLAPLHQAGVPVVVATSDQWFDDPIARFCVEHGIACYRGSSHDVAGRMVAAAEHFELTHFARVNGDSPFVEPELIREALQRMPSEHLDFVTNLVPRTFPYGVAVETIKTAWYAELIEGLDDPLDREHVTRPIYRHLTDYRVATVVRSGPNLSHWRMTVDTAGDLDWFRQFIAGLDCDWTTLGYEHAVTCLQPQRRAG